MSKPLAFFLILIIVVVGQMIALGIHLKKNRKAIVSHFGDEKILVRCTFSFWRKWEIFEKLFPSRKNSEHKLFFFSFCFLCYFSCCWHYSFWRVGYPKIVDREVIR